MPRGKAHSPEVKAAVVAALLAGQGVTEVASQYHLDNSVVSRWKSNLGPEMQEVATKKRNEIDELLTNYLRETLVTLQVQQLHFRDKDWLAKQDASDLAILHGVSTDKAIRLLEAAERVSSEDVATPPGAAD
jgi:transposase-like protein